MGCLSQPRVFLLASLAAPVNLTVMRFWIFCLALVFVVMPFSGCKTQGGNHPQKAGSASPTPKKPVVTLADAISGKVARVNPIGRFIVIVFPIGQLPRLEQRMNVIRNGLKVGEVKITGPQLDDSIVADIVAGDVLPGDIVRSY